MKRILGVPIRHPVAVVTLALVVTAVAAPGIARLRLRTDGHALIPEDAPAVRVDRAVRDTFGIRDPLVVLVQPRDSAGIFNHGTLRLVTELTTAFAHVPGLDSASVRSLATEPSDRFREGAIAYRRLLEPIPETPAEIARLREDLDAFRLHRGTLVAFDGSATVVVIGTPPRADRVALVAALEAAIAAADTAGHDVNVIGAPVAEALLGAHILDDLGIAAGRRSTAAGRDAGAPGSVVDRWRSMVARHVGLLPLSIAVMAIVFLVCFRSVTATLLPLAEAGAALVFVFGLMGWTGVPVYLTMAVLPVILVSMGLADEIHVFSCHARLRAARPERPVADTVHAAMEEMALPVVMTALTTAVGFLSFAVSPLPPVRAFGIFTAVGIVFCMLWTLTVIPALLVLLGPRAGAARGTAHVPRRPGLRGWSALAARLGRKPLVTLAIAVLVLAALPHGIRRVVVQDSWIDGFAKDSAFRRATDTFDRGFFGTHVLLLALDAGRLEARATVPVAEMDHREIRLPSDFVADPELLVGSTIVVARRDTSAPSFVPASWSSFVEHAARRDGRIVVTTPIYHGSALFLLMPSPRDSFDVTCRSQRLAVAGVLDRIAELEDFVRGESRYTVGGALGPPDHVVTAEFVTNDRDPESRVIPRDPERVKWLWDAIGRVQGERRVREIVDSGLSRGLVTVFLKNANFRDTGRLMDTLRVFERERLRPAGIGLEFAGDVAVSQTLVGAIVDSQVRSLVLSLVGVLAVTTLLFRSVRWGLVCMLPAAIAVAATFAVMGWSAIPLGVATSMFASMVLGIGVDFAIHLIQHHRQAVRGGLAPDAAIVAALEATGPPIVINALAVALGFGILVLSRVPANARLGVITVVSLLSCLAATLIVIPALVRVTGGRSGRERGGDPTVPAS